MTNIAQEKRRSLGEFVGLLFRGHIASPTNYPVFFLAGISQTVFVEWFLPDKPEIGIAIPWR